MGIAVSLVKYVVSRTVRRYRICRVNSLIVIHRLLKTVTLHLRTHYTPEIPYVPYRRHVTAWNDEAWTQRRVTERGLVFCRI